MGEVKIAVVASLTEAFAYRVSEPSLAVVLQKRPRLLKNAPVVARMPVLLLPLCCVWHSARK